MNDRFALGTVQFGQHYGIANNAGQVGPDEVKDILQQAKSFGLNTLDTAIAYGDSESVLGSAGTDGWNVVTKLPSLPSEILDVDTWVFGQVEGSLSRLAVDKLYGVLIHSSGQLKGEHGTQLIAALNRLKRCGITQKIGVSIYNPDELIWVMDRMDVDLVQSPLSILDRRLVESGWVKKLANSGVELHVRSIYLQGLLLMSNEQRPVKFERWSSVWEEWSGWLESNNCTPLEACLSYVLGVEDVSKIVVGVDSVDQLNEIISKTGSRLSSLPDWPILIDECLLNPSLWAKL